MKPRSYFAGVVLAALSGSAALAATSVGHPPPGDYLIDSEAVTTTGSGATAVQTIETVVGASGERTLTQRVALAGTAPSSRVVPGDGPNGWCVKPYAGSRPPASALRHACESTRHSASRQGSSASADCGARQVDERWRRLDEKTWQRSLRVIAGSSPSPGSPQGAIDLAMAGMSAEQRAAAQAGLASLPSAGRINAAMAPVIEALQVQVRSGNPKQAAQARQQLEAIGGAGAVAAAVTEVSERWTRVADTCAARR